VGDKIGKLAGKLAFEHVEKMHIKKNDEPPSDNVSQTNTDDPPKIKARKFCDLTS